MSRVAAFDLDGTLTRGDTLLPFLKRYLGTAKLAQHLLACSPWLSLYAMRLLPNHVAKAHLLRRCFAGVPQAQAQDWAADFASQVLPEMLAPWALARLREHQHAGDVCVIVSASPDLYLGAVAQALEVPHLLCTQMEIAQGVYSGEMASANCHGPEKVRRLQNWLTTLPSPLEHLSAYGDTPGDWPMLSLAQAAFYREKPWQI